MFVIKVENRIATEHPLTYENFLLLFPACPRQDTPTNEVIGPYGYEVFVHTSQPTPSKYENTPVSGPYVFDNDVWTNTWLSVPMTEEEIQQVNDLKWWEVRTQRNGYLRLSDWTQLPDSQLSDVDKESWRQYRQQLRDVTSTTLDPFEVILPTPPTPFPRPFIPGIITV